jgi:N-acetylmuramoyl-L-alanine amidase CwlA
MLSLLCERAAARRSGPPYPTDDNTAVVDWRVRVVRSEHWVAYTTTWISDQPQGFLDFSNYPSGEMDPSSLLDNFGISPLSASSIENQRRSTAAKRSRTFDMDNDKELYKQIISIQIMQKEQSRLKTAFNVKRALMANVIICTGACASFQQAKAESQYFTTSLTNLPLPSCSS